MTVKELKQCLDEMPEDAIVYMMTKTRLSRLLAVQRIKTWSRREKVRDGIKLIGE